MIDMSLIYLTFCTIHILKEIHHTEYIKQNLNKLQLEN